MTLTKIGVISGKGGTGKTTVAHSLARALQRKGYRTGMLDVDLTGPNLTDILCKAPLVVEDDRFIPTDEDGLKFISLGQLASEGDPVMWAGDDLSAAAKQLFTETDWSGLEYLIVDFPPGTGNEPQAMIPLMDYVLVVTVPSVLAKSNVERVIELCRESETPILGLVKNMTLVECPRCGYGFNIFPEDHDFEDQGIPTLMEIPMRLDVAKNKLINHFPVELVLEAMKNPVILRKRGKSIRRVILEKVLERMM